MDRFVSARSLPVISGTAGALPASTKPPGVSRGGIIKPVLSMLRHQIQIVSELERSRHGDPIRKGEGKNAEGIHGRTGARPPELPCPHEWARIRDGIKKGGRGSPIPGGKPPSKNEDEQLLRKWRLGAQDEFLLAQWPECIGLNFKVGDPR